MSRAEYLHKQATILLRRAAKLRYDPRRRAEYCKLRAEGYRLSKQAEALRGWR